MWGIPNPTACTKRHVIRTPKLRLPVVATLSTCNVCNPFVGRLLHVELRDKCFACVMLTKHVPNTLHTQGPLPIKRDHVTKRITLPTCVTHSTWISPRRGKATLTCFLHVLSDGVRGMIRRAPGGEGPLWGVSYVPPNLNYRDWGGTV